MHVVLDDAPSGVRDSPDLSPSERARADAFRSELEGARYAAAHVFLRHALAEYVAAPPHAIPLVRVCPVCGSVEHGKPAVEGADVEFNLSHSAGHGLVGIARGAAVGVDLEPISPRVDWAAVGSVAFPRSEIDLLQQTPAAVAPELAARLWCRREAAVKAVGHGLAIDLRELEFTSAPMADWARTSVACGGSRSEVIVREIAVAGGVVAALALVSERPRPVRTRQWAW